MNGGLAIGKIIKGEIRRGREAVGGIV